MQTIYKRVEKNLYLLSKNEKQYYVSRFSLNGKRKTVSLGSTEIINRNDAVAINKVIQKNAYANNTIDYSNLAKIVLRKRCKKTVKDMNDGILPNDKLETSTINKNASIEKTTNDVSSNFNNFKRTKTMKWVMLDFIQFKKNSINEKATNGVANFKQLKSRIERYIFDKLQKVPCHQINKNHIRDIIEPMWMSNQKTAIIVHRTVQEMLIWAFENDYIKKIPVFKPEKALGTKQVKTKHQSSISYQDLPNIYKALKNSDSIQGLLVRFAILTNARIGSICKLRWLDVDFKKKIWVQKNIKGKEEFCIALSDEAIDILHQVKEMAHNVGAKNCEFTFRKWNNSLYSQNEILSFVRKFGYRDIYNNQITTHGFRATFKAWASFAHVDYNLSEMCLQHTSYKTATQAAYDRSVPINILCLVLNAYAEYCETGTLKMFNDKYSVSMPVAEMFITK